MMTSPQALLALTLGLGGVYLLLRLLSGEDERLKAVLETRAVELGFLEEKLARKRERDRKRVEAQERLRNLTRSESVARTIAEKVAMASPD